MSLAQPNYSFGTFRNRRLVRPMHRRPCRMAQGWALLRARAGDFATATLISFLVNLFCYLAIKHVSATSFKVAGADASPCCLCLHVAVGRRWLASFAALSCSMPVIAQRSKLTSRSHQSAAVPCPAGCLKNVLVVWGGILQGDVVSSRELQVRFCCHAVPPRVAIVEAERAHDCAMLVRCWLYKCCLRQSSRRLQPPWIPSPPDATLLDLQGYAISLAGFVLFSAARYRRPAGAGHSGDSSGRGPPKKRQ